MPYGKGTGRHRSRGYYRRGLPDVCNNPPVAGSHLVDTDR